MNTYQTLSPLIKPQPTSDVPQPTQFQWCYAFQDGSLIKGKIESHPEQLSAKWLRNQRIEADYISNDGKTVLLHWDDQDFVCFDLTEQGELLIIASNDNFVGNSMCLVCSPIRSRAQVTEQENQWVGETFYLKSWSFQVKEEEKAIKKSELLVNMSVTPLFPFLSLNFTLKPQRSLNTYQWTYFPYCSFVPWFQVVSSPSQS